MGAAVWSAVLATGAAPEMVYNILAGIVVYGALAVQILALLGTRGALAAER